MTKSWIFFFLQPAIRLNTTQDFMAPVLATERCDFTTPLRTDPEWDPAIDASRTIRSVHVLLNGTTGIILADPLLLFDEHSLLLLCPSGSETSYSTRYAVNICLQSSS